MNTNTVTILQNQIVLTITSKTRVDYFTITNTETKIGMCIYVHNYNNKIYAVVIRKS